MITLSQPDWDAPDRFSVFMDGRYVGIISRIEGSWWSFRGDEEVKHMCKEFAVSHLGTPHTS